MTGRPHLRDVRTWPEQSCGFTFLSRVPGLIFPVGEVQVPAVPWHESFGGERCRLESGLRRSFLGSIWRQKSLCVVPFPPQPSFGLHPQASGSPRSASSPTSSSCGTSTSGCSSGGVAPLSAPDVDNLSRNVFKFSPLFLPFSAFFRYIFVNCGGTKTLFVQRPP